MRRLRRFDPLVDHLERLAEVPADGRKQLKRGGGESFVVSPGPRSWIGRVVLVERRIPPGREIDAQLQCSVREGQGGRRKIEWADVEVCAGRVIAGPETAAAPLEEEPQSIARAG